MTVTEGAVSGFADAGEPSAWMGRISHTYNGRWRQRAIGKLTLVEYELAFTPPRCLADDDAAWPEHRQRPAQGSFPAGRPASDHVNRWSRTKCPGQEVRGVGGPNHSTWVCRSHWSAWCWPWPPSCWCGWEASLA